jgi:hypothetical protein
MSKVICISFTPSHEYREHIQRRYLNERSYGATAGDSFWMGYGDYDEVDPFARYRDDERKPITHPMWLARIEKAKRDIEKHKSEQRVRVMAAALQPSVIKAFLKALNNGES